ncbi:MAG: chromate efflux transporter [Thermodesulfobacteriota bacterium]
MKRPTLFDILKTALYIGSVGYGGPAILAIMKRVIVHEKRWIPEEAFMSALSLSQILPGAPGVTLMGYVGRELKGGWGGILMPFTFVLPAMTTITVLSWAYFSFGEMRVVHSIFTGLGAMVVALLINATLMMGRSVFQSQDLNSVKGLLIAALSFAGILYLRWNVLCILLISGALGAMFFHSGATTVPESRPLPPDPLITPPASPGWRDLLPPAAAAVPLAVTFWLVDGTWNLFSTFFQIGSFAFGGGFTAIPIIQGVVVDGMRWLDLTAFRDGIALGQITPGPVFITSAFIGYKVQGIIGAVVAAAGIFTPSLAAMTLLSQGHAKIRNLRIVKAVIRGFLSGFIGLLLFVVLQFGIQSLVNGKAWTLFAVCLVYLLGWKKDVAWLVLGVIGASLLVFP